MKLVIKVSIEFEWRNFVSCFQKIILRWGLISILICIYFLVLFHFNFRLIYWLFSISFFLTFAHGAVLDCEFFYIRLMKTKGIYKCKVRNLTIQSENETIREVNGEHKAHKANEDVQIFIIENQICHYLPKDLDLHFPKVYHLDVNNSGLKTVTSVEMSMFPKLRHLYIRSNPIEVLPEGLFQHNLLLEFINLNDNQIKQVGENIFEPLTQLVILSFERNICFDGFAIQEEPLRKLKLEIIRNCSSEI